MDQMLNSGRSYEKRNEARRYILKIGYQRYPNSADVKEEFNFKEFKDINLFDLSYLHDAGLIVLEGREFVPKFIPSSYKITIIGIDLLEVPDEVDKMFPINKDDISNN